MDLGIVILLDPSHRSSQSLDLVPLDDLPVLADSDCLSLFQMHLDSHFHVKVCLSSRTVRPQIGHPAHLFGL